jgi:REP-associated tyrosine transposase
LHIQVLSTLAEMSRPLRVQVPGTYHVFAHSVSGRPLFSDADARRLFLRLVGATASRKSWHVQAYCLLTTHYHLLIRIEEENLALGMQWLNGVYGALVNERLHDRGHLFGARYGSSPVTTDAYHLEVIRYVALNPVRAGICDDPADWPWSSYRPLVRGLATPAFLDASELLLLFGRERGIARRRLEAFVCDGIVAAATAH